MKYYIEKDVDGKVITKGEINTDCNIQFNENQIEVTKDVFDNTEQDIPHGVDEIKQPTIEERLKATENALNSILGL